MQEETPIFGTKPETGYIPGMTKVQRGVKILLDIDRVLSRDKVALIKKKPPDVMCGT